MNITIKSDNVFDARVRCYTVDIQSEIDAEPDNGIYLSFAPIILTATIDGQIQDMDIYCEMVVTAGNMDYFIFESKPQDGKFQLNLGDSPGTTLFPISYRPPNFAPDNVLLTYTINVYDKYGLVVSHDFSYCFGRVIKIYTRWHGGCQGDGIITSPDALYSTTGSSLSAGFHLFYCSDAGCTLIAEPDEGHIFRGYYQTGASTGYISHYLEFHYVPKATFQEFYAYFR